MRPKTQKTVLMKRGLYALSALVVCSLSLSDAQALAQSLGQEELPTQLHFDSRVFSESTLDAQAVMRSAQAGDVQAQAELGDLHFNGLGGALRNDFVAAYWYLKAANNGHRRAQFNIGLMYLRAQGMAQSYKDAIHWLGQAARGGEREAFGELYAYYEQTRPNAEKLAEWQAIEADLERSLAIVDENFDDLMKRAQSGDAVAQRRVALRFEQGQVVHRDYGAAAKWYRLSADQGDARAQDNLADLYLAGNGVDKDPAQAAKWYQAAAEQGLSRSRYSLGNLYFRGNGVEKDVEKAANLYETAANDGYDRAQYALGRLYHYGQGRDENQETAVRWFRAAAQQGYAPAQRSLGIAYQFGHGVETDDALAVEWYAKAADQDDAKAEENLGFMYQAGRGVEKNYALAMEWYRKAAAQGSARAQNSIGVMYQFGKGVESNPEEARRWYKMATDQGYEQAQLNLEALGETQ